MFAAFAIGFAVLAALVLGVVAFFRSLGGDPAIHRLNARLQSLDLELALLRADVQVLRQQLASRPPSSSGPVPDPGLPPAEPTVVGIVPPPMPSDATIGGEPEATIDPAGLAQPTGSVPRAARPLEPVPAIPPPSQSLEERLGTRWTVWVGGLALALGGLFLVRYSIEVGLLGPAVRTALAAALACVLLGLGEMSRRARPTRDTSVFDIADIPSILTAAGTVVAFGTVYSAHALYGFIGPTVAFVLLAVVGIAALLASLLHGPAIAGLGLAGTYVAPLLVASKSPSPWPVVILLAVVATVAGILAAVRNWGWLGLVAIAGAGLWGVALLGYAPALGGDWIRATFVHTLLQIGIAGAVLVYVLHPPASDVKPMRLDWASTGALALLTLLAVAALSVASLPLNAWSGRIFATLPNMTERVMFAAIAAALLAAVAWRQAALAPALCLSGVIVIAQLFLWSRDARTVVPSDVAWRLSTVLPVPEAIEAFALFAVLGALAVLAVSVWRIATRPSMQLELAALYLLAGVATPLLALIVAYLRVKQLDTSIPFALFAGSLGLILATAASYFRQRDTATPSDALNLATGACAAGAIAALALMLTMALSRGYLTVAFALAALGCAVVAIRLKLPILRDAVAALGVIVLLRVIWDPRIMGADIGSTPIFNWLLLGYGVPAAALWTASTLLRREAEDRATAITEALALLFAMLLVFFQIRHILGNGDVLRPTTTAVEQGLLFIAAAGFSYGLHVLHAQRRSPVIEFGSLAAGVISIGICILGLALGQNPLFTGELIVGPVGFSTLLLAYGLPALTATVITAASRRSQPVDITTVGSIVAIGLLFAFVSLEVRHLFQGADISITRRTGQPEFWTYSVAWLALGVLLLAYGHIRASHAARIASAFFILLTVGKVFLLDLAGLTGILRALSLLALGGVLIAIGLIYQRFVLRPAPPADVDPPRTVL